MKAFDDKNRNIKPKSNKTYPAIISGNSILCSRCYGAPDKIEKYGIDETGTWFIARCKQCHQKIKWYRLKDGTTSSDLQSDTADPTFNIRVVDGEILLDWGE